jgi:hypothetical protein
MLNSLFWVLTLLNNVAFESLGTTGICVEQSHSSKFWNEKMNQKIIVCIFFLMSGVASSEVCTDDYLITGERLISLLPDVPFQIWESDSILIVRRGGLVFKFANPDEVYEGQDKITRYSTELIADKYYFELNVGNEKKERKWRQYSSGINRRGFGGVCKSP